MRSLALSLALSSLSGCAAVGVGWPGDVYIVEDGGLYGHDLSEGELIDLDWADNSDVACWVETENMNFDGNHVFFALTQPIGDYLTVAATPDPGLDLSIYAMQMTTDLFEVPPSDTLDVFSCEAGFDWVHDANPGEVEYVNLSPRDDQDVHVLIGVAGANGETSGGFELELYSEPTND